MAVDARKTAVARKNAVAVARAPIILLACSYCCSEWWRVPGQQQLLYPHATYLCLTGWVKTMSYSLTFSFNNKKCRYFLQRISMDTYIITNERFVAFTDYTELYQGLVLPASSKDIPLKKCPNPFLEFVLLIYELSAESMQCLCVWGGGGTGHTRRERQKRRQMWLL